MDKAIAANEERQNSMNERISLVTKRGAIFGGDLIAIQLDLDAVELKGPLGSVIVPVENIEYIRIASTPQATEGEGK